MYLQEITNNFDVHIDNNCLNCNTLYYNESFMQKPRKTRLRTFRVEEELDSLLQKDARSKGISVNSLLSIILTKYSEWDRYIEKFSTISVKKESFKTMLSAIDDDKVTDISQELGDMVPSQFILFWFKKNTLENYLKYLSLICKHGGFAQYEIELEGREYTITLIHELGQKWSNFLANWMSSGMKSAIGIVPRIKVIQNSVIARFTAS
jgi:hypothetical protein